MVEVGALYPLTKDGEIDSSIPSLSILEGLNEFGRNDSALFSKQVSRKHISINVSPSGTLEIAVEGPNPIVLRSGSDMKKLFPRNKWILRDGDVIEFIPHKLPFTYVAVPVCQGRNLSLVIPNPLSNEKQGALLSEANLLDEVCQKRKRQVDEDEALARLLQEQDELSRKRTCNADVDESLARLLQEEENRAAADEFKEHGFSSTGLDYSNMPATTQSIGVDEKCKRWEIEHAEGGGASSFQLMHTQGIPRWANNACIRIQDVIRGDIQLAILSNYMVDVNWLLSACPLLSRVPQVVMIHGETGQSLEMLQMRKPKNWTLFKPPLRLSYGTHHSKAMFLVYPTGVRIIVHTANLIQVDWNNKTQGLWMQDFPFKDPLGQMSRSDFEDDFVEYLGALEWPGCTMIFPQLGKIRINANFFRKFNYSCAAVRLVASVPGYHRSRDLTRWGHMKLRRVLQEQSFEDEFRGSPVVFQFSSLGSLDEKWLNELTTSICAGSTFAKKPLGIGKVQIVWPTVEDIRCSLEGYAAGNAVPSPDKNVKKEFLKKYWARWKAEHTGRSRAIPHMKSYVRYNGQSLAWFLLTSSNLSKAAWGTLQKNGTQIMIRSYELGVCFLPSLVLRPSMQPFSCTDNAPSTTHGGHLSSPVPETGSHEDKVHHGKLVTSYPIIGAAVIPTEKVVRLPVPYSLPPPTYEPEDVPWTWDRQYEKPDVYGDMWPRSVQL
ncbi:unnamed protein product [Calypogeia fissa]